MPANGKTFDMPSVMCPKCGEIFEVTGAWIARIRTQLAEENQQRLETQRSAIHQEEADRARKELDLEYQDLSNQLKEAETERVRSNEAELELRRQVRKYQREAEEAELEKTRHEDELRQQIGAAAEERYAAKLRAKDEQLARVESEAEELRRKASKGSPQEEGVARQQLFGEALQSRFPSDTVIVVKQGQNGADVKHVIHDQGRRPLGLILWESKRAADWSATWLTKLKKDQQQVGADIAVLVSAVLPRDQGPVIQMDGVWVCNFAYALALGLALREIILKVASFQAANASRDVASAKVYDYIATGSFAQRIISMVETISCQRDHLFKEQRAQQQSWKIREAQLQSFETQLACMVGDLLGLGATIPEPARFELKPPA
jgi:hypothetical protein